MQLNISLWEEEHLNVSLLGDHNSSNASDLYDDYPWEEEEDVFEYLYVRIPLIVAYTIVFLCCFFGNLIVMVVVMVHRRMRTATNFFLANLALADFCVGVFCVYQNLLLYLTSVWNLGDFLCRMYHFVHGLSYTASILILMVISLERYVVIVHPMWGRRFITVKRLRIVLVILWSLSAVYNCPRLFLYGTVEVPSWEKENEFFTLCVNQRSVYNSAQFDLYNFAILFVVPLLVMGGLYTSIGLKLWRSERLHGERMRNCCFCIRPKRRKIPRPRLNLIETPSLQGSVAEPSSRQVSAKESPAVNRLREDPVTTTKEELDSSCVDGNVRLDSPNRESIKSSLNTLGPIVRQSSFRSGSNRRINGSIKFANLEPENNRLSSVPPHVLNSVHRSSLKIIIGDRGSLKERSKTKAAEYEDVLLLNKANTETGQTEKVPNIVDSDVESECEDSTIIPTETSRHGSFRSVSQREQKRTPIGSASQRVHQSNGSETPAGGQSIRSCASEVSTYLGSESQRSRTDESILSGKKGKRKMARKGSKVLRSRRKIIRLLIAILCSFAACNLPFHARKFWQTMSPSYRGDSSVSLFLTISTTLVLYLNSGINPFLYAFLSANFRKSVKDVLMCKRQLWTVLTLSSGASNNSRLTTTTSSGVVSQASMSSVVSNF